MSAETKPDEASNKFCDALDAFIRSLGVPILETVRSGAAAISRGAKAMHI